MGSADQWTKCMPPSQACDSRLEVGSEAACPAPLRKWPKCRARSLENRVSWGCKRSAQAVAGRETACCLSKTLKNIMIYLSEEKIWIMYWLYGAWISFVLIVRKACIQRVRGGGAAGPRDHRVLRLKEAGPRATAIDLQMSSRRLINGGANESSGWAWVKK